ncbi:MAG TPA: hypothetical protein VEB43_03145 [Anaeromyxobacter sp.]|nr:hypothetical protein [Anaeromyxobacter sp.]
MHDRPTTTPAPGHDSEATSHVSAASPRGQAAAGLVGALAKAARAFTLYDPGNALVRQFIGDYRARVEAATAGGPVELEVKPFELLCGREVVYHEEDRERSLAFKLFRDGVRSLTFARAADGDELLRLLQILAVRFVGIRQAEDDVVTLLRKEEFRSISFTAVEGYTSEEQTADAGLRHRGGEPPPGFDTPFPKLPPPGPIAYVPIPDAALGALRGEEAPEALGVSGVRLAAELVAWAARGALPAAEVAQLCGELRDFLVADGQLALLASLAELPLRLAAGPLRDELLRGLADARLLEAVIGSLPAQGGALPPEALRLVPFVPAAAVMDRLAAEEAPGRRAALLAIVEERLPADADAVAAKLPGLGVELVRELLKLLARKAPDRADPVSLALLGHADASLQLEALRALAGSAQKLPAAPFVEALRSPVEAIRIAAAHALEHHGDTAAARAVADALTSRKGYSRDEAAALGRTLGALHAGAALRLFDGWLEHKKSLLGGLRGGEHDELLRWAAVAGLGVIPGAEAEQRLEAVAQWAGEELRRHVHGTVGRRRAEARRLAPDGGGAP